MPLTLSSEQATRSSPARKLPKEQWDFHREMIKNLYAVKGITAKDILVLLETRGFTVTERQLKRKIGDWKLDKNVKRDEMQMIILKQQRRRDEKGKGTIFRVRGRHVPQAKIERFQKRNEAFGANFTNDKSMDVIRPSTPASPTLSVISYETSSERDCLSPRPTRNVQSLAFPRASMSSLTLYQTSSSDRTCGMSILQSLEAAARHFPNFPALYARKALWQVSISDDQFKPEDIQFTDSISDEINGQALSSSVAFMIPKSLQDDTAFRSPESIDMHAEEFDLRQKLHTLQLLHGLKHQTTLECLLKLGHYLLDHGGSTSAEDTLTSEISKMGGMGIDDPNPIALRLYLLISQSLISQSKETMALYLLKSLLDKVCHPSAPSSIRIEIMLSYGNCLHTSGDVAGGEDMFKKAIDIGGRLLAPDHSLMLNAFRLLAKSLRLQGNFSEAEKVLRIVAQSPNVVYGKNFRYNLSAFCELGMVLRLQRKFQEAERLLQIVLTRQLHILGAAHKVTIFSQIELGAVRAQRCGDPSLIQEAYCQATNLFGKSHWLSTYACRALACWLSSNGQLDEAETILEQVLEDCIAVNEISAVDKYMTEHLLGHVYHMQGQLEKAAGKMESAFSWSGQAFGLGHPHVKQTWNDLAEILRDKVMKKSLEIDEIGNPHPDQDAECDAEGPVILESVPSTGFRGFIEL